MGRNIHCSSEEKSVIKTLRNLGKTIREIAEIVGCSKNMVCNALKLNKTEENRGGKRKTTPKTDRRIVKLVKSDPFKSSQDVKNELNLNVSTRTIRRRLVENNLLGRSARKVPCLSLKNVGQRLTFANERVNWYGDVGIRKWRNILWSDESKVNLFGSDGRRYVRRPPNQEFNVRYTKKTVKHGGGNIKVWACFSWYGVGPIYLIKEIMDQHIYVDDILQTVMLPYADENMPLRWIFQQDNDPKHTSKKAKAFFLHNKLSILPWPAQSPDLNPIENLWNDLKNIVALKKVSNKNQLWTEIQKAWYSIPLERCQRLVDSMPRRCAAVIKNNGHATKY